MPQSNSIGAKEQFIAHQTVVVAGQKCRIPFQVEQVLTTIKS